MLAVILGAGNVGSQIAGQLIEEGKDVVIIERDPARAKEISDKMDCIVVNEDGTNISTLKKAGIEKADVFISVTKSDEVNMIACGLVSSEFPDVKTKIARVRNLDYSEAKIIEKTFLGIDYAVNSEVETARKIVNTVELGASSDVVLFENTSLQLRNITVEDGSIFENRALKELRSVINVPFLIAGIISVDQFIIPSGNTVLKNGDILYLLAGRWDLAAIFKKSGHSFNIIKNIVILGAGKIGRLICRELNSTGRRLTVIEKNYEICRSFAEEFPEVLVLNADIADDEIFSQEDLGSNDLIITTTDNQELNILISALGKRYGIKRSIALVTKASYFPMAAELGIDSTISPKNSTVDAIMKYIRKGDIKSVHSIFDGKAEVIEFSIDNDNIMAGKALVDISLPENTLVLSVIRKKTSHLPTGGFVIMPGDVVILISSKESIARLEAAFLD